MRINISALVLACLAVAACGGGGGDTSTGPPGPFQMTFSLDSTFQGPHGNQPIRIAVVRSSDNVVVAGDNNGTVSATLIPSYSFVSGAVMERGTDYEVHYWIDSNIGGGTLGVCDSITTDHQWRVEFPSVTNDKDFTVSYQPALAEDVCSTFP